MLQELMQMVAKRRAKQRAAEEEWDRLGQQPHVRNAKRFRRWLLVFLVFVGAAALVEVVLFPGVMLRRNVTQPEQKTKPLRINLQNSASHSD